MFIFFFFDDFEVGCAVGDKTRGEVVITQVLTKSLTDDVRAFFDSLLYNQARYYGNLPPSNKLIKSLGLPFYRQIPKDTKISIWTYYAHKTNIQVKGQALKWLKNKVTKLESVEDDKYPLDFKAFILLIDKLTRPSNVMFNYYQKQN